MAREDAHDVDVERHGLFDPGTLDLDGDLLAAAQPGAMDLGEARAAERRRIDRDEELLATIAPELGVERGEHVLERQRIAPLRLKLGEPSQYARGRISERVESVCPIFTNEGPRSSSIARNSSGVTEFMSLCLRTCAGSRMRARRVFGEDRTGLQDRTRPTS